MPTTTNDIEQQMAKKQAEEQANRVNDANHCKHLLSTLMLGERLDTGPNSHVLAVPNGWIFYEQHKAGITSTFVPAPPPTAHRTLAEKMIQV